MLEVEPLRTEGIVTCAATARALIKRDGPTPLSGPAWTHAAAIRAAARARRGFRLFELGARDTDQFCPFRDLAGMEACRLVRPHCHRD